MQMKLLHAAFGSSARFSALQALSRNRTEPKSPSALASEAGVTPWQMSKLLKSWEAVGLVVKTGSARHWKYQLSHDPALLLLNPVLESPAVIEDELSKLLSNNASVEAAGIFGSYARGQMDSRGLGTSDIDVLAIGQVSELQLNASLLSLARRLGRKINAMCLTPAQLNELRTQRDPVIRDIESNLIIVKGQI